MSDDILLALLQPIIDRVRTDVSAVKVIGGEMWRSDDALTRARLMRHLGGAQVRGAYLIKPGESVVRAAVLDLDDHAKVWPWADVAAVAARLIRVAGSRGLKANAWSSSSGHGIHLWFLWDEAQDAHSVREALAGVLSACMLTSGSGGLDKGEVEIFPKQDSVDVGAYGNQVWLPLGGVSRPLEPDLVDGTLRPVPLEWLVNVYDVGGWDWTMSDAVPVVEAEARVSASVDVSLWDEARWSASLREWRAQLDFVRDYSYTSWMEIGFALHDGSGGSADGLALWEEWSARGPEYEAGVCEGKWRSMGSDKKSSVTIRTLAFRARAGGWVEELPFEDVSAGAVRVDGVGHDPIMQDQPRFERDREGRILPTAGNIMLALECPWLTGYTVAVDEFKDELMFAQKEGQWSPFLDVHYNRIKLALENRGKGFRPVSRTDVRECVLDMAARNVFDSAQLWLKGLQWDGVRRIDRFLYDYWGALNTEYTRAVGAYLWTALAGRVMSPGCQVDMVPILVGDEGTGKSSTITSLVPSPDHVCEISFDEKDDDIARKLRGVLAVEIAELRGLGTRDEESIYAFVTRRREKWVPKFKEFTDTFPRRAVLFGTANDPEFLGKEGRRWLPFNVGARAGRSEDDLRPELVERDRDQLWAEARERCMQNGVEYHEAMRLGPAAREAFILSHPWEDRVREWLSDYAEVVGVEGGVPSSKVLSMALGITGRATSSDGRQLSRVMARLGYEPRRTVNGKLWVPRVK